LLVSAAIFPILRNDSAGYIQNLEGAVITTRRTYYTTPALCQVEAFAIGDLLKVERAIVDENFGHVGGIPRYLFDSLDS